MAARAAARQRRALADPLRDTSDLNACFSASQRTRTLIIICIRLGSRKGFLRPSQVDVLGEFGDLGDHVYGIGIDRQKTSVNGDQHLAAVGELDPNGCLNEEREDRFMSRHNADLPVGRLCHNTLRRTTPQCSLGRDHVDLQFGHDLVALGQCFGVLLDILDSTAHEEGLLRQVIVDTFGQRLEGCDRLLDGDE